MTFENTHLLVKAIGHFGTVAVSNDTWSSGLRIANPTPAESPPNVDYTSFLADLAPLYQSFHQNASTAAGSSCYIDELTLARIGPDGKYNPPEFVTNRHTYTVKPVGVGTPTGPWSQSFVYSLRTAIPRGYASNGRVYWPCLVPALDATTGRMNTATVAARLTPFKTLLDSINALTGAIQPGLAVCVMSRVGSGQTAYVTHVRADGRMDSQERRENDQVSVYQTVQLA